MKSSSSTILSCDRRAILHEVPNAESIEGADR